MLVACRLPDFSRASPALNRSPAAMAKVMGGAKGGGHKEDWLGNNCGTAEPGFCPFGRLPTANMFPFLFPFFIPVPSRLFYFRILHLLQSQLIECAKLTHTGTNIALYGALSAHFRISSLALMSPSPGPL